MATARVMGRTGHSSRRDIQGLRALAVGLVIVYHLRPTALVGGFIGVDVFFVVSGFLIIGSLVREAAKRASISVLAFYARRVRRLFPASAAVLIAVAIGTILLLPQSRWQAVSSDVLFSLLEVQNWHQALSAVSYAGATQEVSPLQHFWSLAVEEQFYLAVPFFLLGIVVVARRVKQPSARFVIAALTVVTGVSFVYSVYLSDHEHTIAYFATTTRIWEIALGGLAALMPPIVENSARWAAGTSWLGLAAVVVPAFFVTTEMPFPGSVAAIPAFGTAMMLRAGLAARAVRWSASSLWSARPIVFVGDVSYSLYLWHWPVVVFAVAMLDRAPRISEAVGLAALSLLLATASYRWIEHPFRNHSPQRPPQYATWLAYRRIYSFALCMALIVASAAWAPWQAIEFKRAQLSVELSDHDYPGAQAWSNHPASVPAGLPIRPDPSVAMQDFPATEARGCAVYDPASVPDADCWFGSTPQSGTPTIVVVGDSHAGQFIDPLITVSNTIPLSIHAMVRNGCPFALTPPRSADRVFWNCPSQNAISIAKIIEQKPNLVLIAGMREASYHNALGWTWSADSPLVDGYVQTLSRLRAAGLRVAVIADLPYPHGNPVECVQKHGTADECETTVAEGFSGGEDPLLSAAGRVSGVEIVDLSRLFCRDGGCPAFIGNVLVYRDNHMTNTFAKSLAPDLAVALRLSP